MLSADLTALQAEEGDWNPFDRIDDDFALDFDFDFGELDVSGLPEPEAVQGLVEEGPDGEQSRGDEAVGQTMDGSVGRANRNTAVNTRNLRWQASRLNYSHLVDGDYRITDIAWQKLEPLFWAHRFRFLRPSVDAVLLIWHSSSKVRTAAIKSGAARRQVPVTLRRLTDPDGRPRQEFAAMRPAGSEWKKLDDDEWRTLARHLATEKDEVEHARDRTTLGALAWLISENRPIKAAVSEERFPGASPRTKTVSYVVRRTSRL